MTGQIECSSVGDHFAYQTVTERLSLSRHQVRNLTDLGVLRACQIGKYCPAPVEHLVEQLACDCVPKRLPFYTIAKEIGVGKVSSVPQGLSAHKVESLLETIKRCPHGGWLLQDAITAAKNLPECVGPHYDRHETSVITGFSFDTLERDLRRGLIEKCCNKYERDSVLTYRAKKLPRISRNPGQVVQPRRQGLSVDCGNTVVRCVTVKAGQKLLGVSDTLFGWLLRRKLVIPCPKTGRVHVPKVSRYPKSCTSKPSGSHQHYSGVEVAELFNVSTNNNWAFKQATQFGVFGRHEPGQYDMRQVDWLHTVWLVAGHTIAPPHLPN